MGLPAPAPDRTSLVTGASSGIGVEIARELARRRHGVVLVARREGPLTELAAELRSEHSVRAEVVALDLTDADARRKLPAALAEMGMVVDVLVNNAGFSTSGSVATADEERETAMARTNVEAVVSLTTLFVPGMVERRRGAVLNVASTAAFQPLPGQAGYSASKAFVLSYTEALRAEVSPAGVKVTALCPGPVETEFMQVAEIADVEAYALPKFMWLSAKAVAAAGVDGLEHGRAVVIPGIANMLSARAAYLTPRSLLLPLIASRSPILKR
jgi:short-subunit dehydrogenase